MNRRKSLALGEIRAAVATHFGLAPKALAGPDRCQTACRRRAVAYRLCAELTDASLTRIGRAFGGRDHTTVINALARPLPLEYHNAYQVLCDRLLAQPGNATVIARRWPFKSCRNLAVQGPVAS